MATGVVIRLTNLPLAAGTIDIRHFFSGLRIPDGGVHIIGGDNGTTFILFSTDEDARQAMHKDGQKLCGAAIKLMLSSHTEMKSVIEHSQKLCEQLRGKRHLKTSVSNTSTQPHAKTNQKTSDSFQTKIQNSSREPKSLDANDVYVEIKSMPFSVNQTDIVYFFAPLNVSAIKFMLDDKGRKNGSGYIKFASPNDKLEGLKRDRRFIGSRFVKLASVSERQWLLANSQPCETIRLESEIAINRKRQQSHVSPEETTPKRSRDLSPLVNDNCVEVSGLPSSSAFKDVGDFFARLKFVDGGLFVEMDGSLCKGVAYVEFKSRSDYEQALVKDGDILNGKQVRVISLSKQTMMDKIALHKKYIKSKREEFEKQKIQKNMRDSEMQKKKDYQIRKQKEMDEWLRRQHEKEEKDLKKVENIPKSSEKIDEKKLLEQLLFDSKTLEALKQTDDSQFKQELIKKLEELAGKSIATKSVEVADEALLGACEMDIEDDNVTEQSVSTSVSNQLQQIVSSTSTSFSYPVLGTGNSGSLITSQLPLSFNPPIPLISPPFPLPKIPPIQSNLTSNITTLPTTHILPLISKPFASAPPPALNPPLPLPPITVPPPALPTAPLPFQPPAISQTVSIPVELDCMQTPLLSLPIHDTELLEKKFNQSHTNCEYIRVANSPYNATEEEIRNFFNDVSIPQNGIQFINKLNGNRSGHIFIKCSSAEDATKAIQKNNQKLCGRNVLVKYATMKLFEDIYYKLTKGQHFVPSFNNNGSKHLDDDNIFTRRILDDKMTCVCIGNIPLSGSEEDIIRILGNIKYKPSKLVVMRDYEGNCKGDAYVELEDPFECVKAANLHGIAEIGGQIVRVLPLTSSAMEKDLIGSMESSENLNKTQSNGHTYNLKPFPRHESRMSFSRHLASSHDYISNSVNNSLTHPPFNAADLLFPPADDILGISNPLLDPLAFSPQSHIPPPLSAVNNFLHPPPPLPFNSGVISTIKMSNLSYKVTREDILEFFAHFSPLPDSIRLMYNNNGKLTGDGIISFSSFEAAKAAVDQLHGKQFLSRKIKLLLH